MHTFAWELELKFSEYANNINNEGEYLKYVTSYVFLFLKKGKMMVSFHVIVLIKLWQTCGFKSLRFSKKFRCEIYLCITVYCTWQIRMPKCIFGMAKAVNVKITCNFYQHLKTSEIVSVRQQLDSNWLIRRRDWLITQWLRHESSSDKSNFTSFGKKIRWQFTHVAYKKCTIFSLWKELIWTSIIKINTYSL